MAFPFTFSLKAQSSDRTLIKQNDVSCMLKLIAAQQLIKNARLLQLIPSPTLYLELVEVDRCSVFALALTKRNE